MAALAGLGALAVAARSVATERAAGRWWRGEDGEVLAVADALAVSMAAGTTPGDFSTGDARFDGEWALVSCQMTVLSLVPLAAAHPDRAPAYGPAIRACADWLATPEARAFGAAAWGRDALDDPDLGHTHAYLGWTAVALATAGAAGDDGARRAAAALTDRLAASVDGRPLAALETYPGETYPPDLAVVAAALGVQGGHGEVLERFVRRFRAEALDPDTGLVHQTLGRAGPGPVRGSGSALAAHFLAVADPALGAEVAGAVAAHLRDRVGPFGGIREVPRGARPAQDIDSGPVIFGLSVAASGFGLSAARQLGDEAWHRELFRSAHTAGLGTHGWFWSGGALGNAVLLTMLTAPVSPSSR